MTSATVGDEDLERRLRAVCASAAGPAAGIFGPNSLTWRIDREAAIFLGAGRALLLQLAHPWVARAIAEHSRTLTDPVGRFHRTFRVMFTMVFGSHDQALAAARRLHHRHATVSGVMPVAVGPFADGSPYWANEVSALRWVHATLIDTALLVHGLVLGDISDDERELYYAESRLFAALFGIPQSCVPPDWRAFADDMESMCASETLTVSADARAIAEQILGGATMWLRVPRWYRAVTARMLPPPFREAFGLPYGDAESRVAEIAIRWIRRIYPLLPAQVRYVGPYHEAQARLAGRPRPGPVTRLSNQAWIGRSLLG